MNGRPKNLRPWALGGCLALALAWGGCKDDTEQYAPDTDSETHWLQPCEEDAVCGALSCVCGVCVKACDEDAACAPLGQGALCRPADGSLGCGLTPEGGVCLPGCDADDECGALGDEARCVDGACAVVEDEPSEELCGDRIDNDRDGSVDEGCDAPPVEVCEDGLDNDLDGLVDEECANDGRMLCEGTDGRWDETSCGHYQCGNPPSCEAIIPGCDCGGLANFVEGAGCVQDRACGEEPVDEECDGVDNDRDGEVDEGCELMPEECGDGIDNDRDGLVDEECGADNLALCVETGGRWDERSCGDYVCGQGPLCDAIIPGCDCGERANFVDGQGCVEDPACGQDPNREECGDGIDNDRDGQVDEDCDPAEERCGDGIDNDGDGSVDETCDRIALLCEGSGGRWHPESCGDYVCGDAPDCEAIIPGCDCGPTANFSQTRGCFEDDACGGIIVGEACDGIDNDRDGEVDEGCPPNTDAALCERTNGDWVENSCGHYSCGDAPLCNAVIPGCNCGELANFVDGQGCVEDRACR